VKFKSAARVVVVQRHIAASDVDDGFEIDGLEQAVTKKRGAAMYKYQEPRDLRVIHAVANVLWTLAIGIAELILVVLVVFAVAHLVMR
jgi:hypothetical protein